MMNKDETPTPPKNRKRGIVFSLGVITQVTHRHALSSEKEGQSMEREHPLPSLHQLPSRSPWSLSQAQKSPQARTG